MMLPYKRRKIIAHFKHSIITAEKWSNMQQQMNTAQLDIKQDVATHCNFSYIITYIKYNATKIGRH